MQEILTTREFRARALLLVMAALALLVLLAAASAQAARVHKLEISEALPNEEVPLTVAINQGTHHLYVVAGDCCGNSSIYNLDENGEVDPLHPKLTGAPTLDPFGIAVDNSGGSHQGYIYAANIRDTVQQFDPDGAATGVTITESAIPADGTSQSGGLPPVVNSGSFQPRYVTVDESGNVFVFNSDLSGSDAQAIDVFKPTGEFVRQIGAGEIGGITGFAVDSSGHVFISRSGPDVLGPGLFELDASTGECVQPGCAPIDATPSEGVAVDNAGGIVYSAVRINFEEIGREESEFREYEATSGALLGVTRPAALRRAIAIAVDESSDRVVVLDTGDRTVKIFGPLEIVPDVETLAPEEETDRSVTLKGEIGAAEVPGGATCTFQYVDQAAFEANGFQGAAEAPCEPAGPFTGSAMNPVEAKVTELRGGTTYHERILGTNDNGSNPGEDIPFETKGPTVTGTEATEVEEGEATLHALVDPNGADTTYRFQYLTQAQFEAGGWSGATEVPPGGEDLGSGEKALPVEERIEGLDPDTAYRFRVLATSSGGANEGETQGEEVVFTTFAPPTVGLPDGRRYEQASPLDKNGTNVQTEINGAQASLDGTRISFFSNSGIPGSEGAQEFPTYLATRSSGSWSTDGLLPPASYGSRASVLGWTENLEDAYDFASKPFEGAKLLRRGGPGDLTQVGETLAGGGSGFGPYAYAGSSDGGAVALLESEKGDLLEGDLEGKKNLYAYDRESGTLALAGVMNDGTVPPAGAMAGSYDWAQGAGDLGEGGASRSYYTQAQHAISTDGSRVFFTAAGTGQLYVRVNPLAPQSATAGEECTEAARACTVRISAPDDGTADPETPAAFLGASEDGRLVYFLDKGRLTADGSKGKGFDLYRYDVESDELTDLSIDIADRQGARVEGMLGIGGPAGEDAYFVAAGKLAPGTTEASKGETNLYALHGTEVDFVTRLEAGTEGGDRVNWVPTSTPNPVADTFAHASRLSADGQTLLFSSIREQTAFDNHGKPELYLYRSGQGIDCISCNPTGAAPAGAAGVQQVPNVGFQLAHRYGIMTRNLSSDGRRVIFDSEDQLVSADRNDVNDVYQWEAEGKGSCAEARIADGCVSLLSGGAEGADPTYFGDADQSGDNAFLFTSQPLVAQDRDELVDVYDARVGGGIAAQEEVRPVPCEGEAGCRGAATAPPGSPAAGSATFTGPGNSRPAPRCRKGKVRRHGRCVAKRKHHHKHKQKRHQGRGKGGRR